MATSMPLELNRGSSSPRVRNGLLVWAAVVLFMALSPLFMEPYRSKGDVVKQGFTMRRVVATASGTNKALSLLGGALSVAICLSWYHISKSRELRGSLAKWTGNVLFGMGSFCPYAAFSQFALVEVFPPERVAPRSFAVSQFCVQLLVGAALLAGAYYLQFARQRPSEGQGTGGAK